MTETKDRGIDRMNPKNRETRTPEQIKKDELAGKAVNDAVKSITGKVHKVPPKPEETILSYDPNERYSEMTDDNKLIHIMEHREEIEREHLRKDSHLYDNDLYEFNPLAEMLLGDYFEEEKEEKKPKKYRLKVD